MVGQVAGRRARPRVATTAVARFLVAAAFIVARRGLARRRAAGAARAAAAAAALVAALARAARALPHHAIVEKEQVRLVSEWDSQDRVYSSSATCRWRKKACVLPLGLLLLLCRFGCCFPSQNSLLGSRPTPPSGWRFVCLYRFHALSACIDFTQCLHIGALSVAFIG